MSIATSSPPVAEQRFLLSDVSWSFYEHLLEELNDRRNVRVTFDRGDLELMSPSLRHESWGNMLGAFVEILAEELEMPLICARSTTFRRKDVNRGLEPDNCYYIERVQDILGKEDLDLRVDPPPDLAIEIEVSRSAVSRMPIYAALRIPQIWRYGDDRLQVYCLASDGDYVAVDESPTFPGVSLDKVAEFLRQSLQTDDISLQRAFREWVRADVLPRIQDNESGSDSGP